MTRARCFLFSTFFAPSWGIQAGANFWKNGKVGAFELGQIFGSWGIRVGANFWKMEKLGHSSWDKVLKNGKFGAFEAALLEFENTRKIVADLVLCFHSNKPNTVAHRGRSW